jgi:hypothetical protein
MFKRSGIFLLVITVWACGGGNSPIAPAATTAFSLAGQVPDSAPTGVNLSTVQPMAFELSGVATDGDGQPVANAELYLDFVNSDVARSYAHATAVTDGTGFYRVDIAAIPGAMHGPAGTNDAVAFGRLSRSGYDDDFRYIVGATHDIAQKFHLHRVARITAGASADVTVAPDDAICVNNVQDMHPWPEEFVCRTVRITAPLDGTMTVEALPVQGAIRPGLAIETINASGCLCLGNPASFSVTAGTEVIANVEMAWGSPTSQSFVVKTSLARP